TLALPVSLSSGQFIVATATDAPGNTSEFSPPFATDAPPVLDLPGPDVNYTENDPATLLDPNATLTDPIPGNLVNATLTVEFHDEGGDLNDRLEIHNGNAADSVIGTNGPDVLFAGTVIGTYTGGDGFNPLVVTFNGNAAPIFVQDLLRSITFRNV